MSIKLGSREIKLPKSPIARIGLGIGLILAGIVGFLPILGFWMIPLGLFVLAEDMPPIKRFLERPGVQNFFLRIEALGSKIASWWRRTFSQKA
jgi:hypothetical protein